MRMRRQEVRRGRPAAEREPERSLADDGEAGVLEHRRGRPAAPAARAAAPSTAAVVEQRGRAVGTRERGREDAHALDRVAEPRVRRRRLHLEQVAQHDEVVDRAALVVAAVGQHLLGQLAAQQVDARAVSASARRTPRRRARARARCGSRGCRARRPRRSPRAGGAAARGCAESSGEASSGSERQRGDPVADARRERIRMPRVVVARRMRLDPARDERARLRESPARAAARTSSPYWRGSGRAASTRSSGERRLERRRAPQLAPRREPARVARRLAAREAPAGKRAQRPRAQLPRPRDAQRVQIERLTRAPPRTRHECRPPRRRTRARAAPSRVRPRRGARAAPRRPAAARARRAAPRRRPAGRAAR